MLGVARELPVLLHALEEIRDPAGVGLDVHHGEAREVLEDPVPDEAHHGAHRLEGMRQDVPRGVRVHAVAVGGEVGRARVVEADGLPQALDLGPEREVVAVVEVAAPDRVRAEVEADRAQRGRAPRLGARQLDVLEGQHRRPAQALGGGGRVLRAPVVVGAAAGGEQRRVLELAPEELPADGRVEDLHVDPLAVHVGEAALGAEARLARRDEALHALHEGGDEVGRVEGVLPLGGQRLALDQVLAPAGLEPRGARAELGSDVALPHVRGLHLMGVGVEDPAAVAHGPPPVSASILQPPPRIPESSPSRPDRA